MRSVPKAKIRNSTLMKAMPIVGTDTRKTNCSAICAEIWKTVR
jgi:hypothetical protein